MTTEALVPAAAVPAIATGGGGAIVLPQVFSVNYFCRFGATILAGSVRHQSAAGTPPSRPGRKAHNCHPSRGRSGCHPPGPERSCRRGLLHTVT